ncbi:parallel beta-helix repeat [Methanobacterium lacus]|uniref:Parallel beta-helix repeat n=1 Tax=Methanobacterium lacus (strain AL-21) TaxID=877455 RepID=F0T9N3_METLA|nr:right-handed parallel beta-helix repeat-containing protein [Methanobacterium lacus]ADZ09912.1 parallel beta-helix repeat [Methanobacterium lacus]
MRPSTNTRPIVAAACLLILVGMILAPVGAANVTVNSGMKNSDIQNLIDNAKSGDTIKFNGGDYQNVSIVINKKLNVVGTKNVVLNGTDSADSNGKTTFVFYFTSKSSGTVLSGFNINTYTDYAVILNNVNNVNIANNNINGGAKGSIYVASSSNINLTQNTIKNSDGNGVTIDSSKSVTLYKNLINHNHGDGVTVLNTQITNFTLNKISYNELNAITLKNSNNTLIHNNSINNNKGNGIDLYNTKTTNITGNNITYNILNGILFDGCTTFTYVSYNYFIHNLNGIYLDSISYGDIIVTNFIAKSYKSAFTPYEFDYTGTGIMVGDNFKDDDSKINIYYNSILGNEAYSIKSNVNYGYLTVGANFYGTNDKWACAVCPMIKTDMLYAKVVKGVNGVKLIFYQPSNANQQVTQVIDQSVNWIVSELNPDGTITQIKNKLGQITNGTSFFNFTRNNSKTYIVTAIINGVQYTYQWDPDNNTDQPNNGTGNSNGTKPGPGNSNSTGTGNNTNGTGGTVNNGTGGQSNSNGTGNGNSGSGTSNSNGTVTGSGEDITQVGFEGTSANNGGQQSAGDSSGGSESGVEVAIKNAITKTVTNPFNNLGIIALLGLIGIGYFKRDKFK